MGPFSTGFIFFLALTSTSVVIAVPLEERAGNVCSSGIYGELAPILAQYSIAQTFCSAVYPISCTTAGKQKRAATTTTSTTKTSVAAKIAATTTTTRTSSAAAARTPTTTTSRTSTSASAKTSSTTSSQDSKASAWSKCQKQPGNVISTMCSCIETPIPCKITTSTTSRVTTSSSSTTTSSVPSTTISSTASSSTTTSSMTTTSSSSSTTSSSTTTTSSSMVPSATCEADIDGGYTASDGAFYQVMCNFFYSASTGLGGNMISVDQRGTFGACIDACESTPSCVAVDYNRITIGEGQEAGLCFLLSSADPRYGGDFNGGDAATRVAAAPSARQVISRSVFQGNRSEKAELGSKSGQEERRLYDMFAT